MDIIGLTNEVFEVGLIDTVNEFKERYATTRENYKLINDVVDFIRTREEK